MMASITQNHDFEGWRGSRETSCAQLCAQHFSTCSWERLFSNFSSVWDPKGSRGRTPRTTFSVTFSNCASFGRPWGAQGCQNTHQEHDKNFKICSKMTPKGPKTTSQRPANEANHSTNKLIDRSIGLGTVAGLPQAIG